MAHANDPVHILRWAANGLRAGKLNFLLGTKRQKPRNYGPEPVWRIHHHGSHKQGDRNGYLICKRIRHNIRSWNRSVPSYKVRSYTEYVDRLEFDHMEKRRKMKNIRFGDKFDDKLVISSSSPLTFLPIGQYNKPNSLVLGAGREATWPARKKSGGDRGRPSRGQLTDRPFFYFFYSPNVGSRSLTAMEKCNTSSSRPQSSMLLRILVDTHMHDTFRQGRLPGYIPDGEVYTKNIVFQELLELT
ncbi:hypothetical protein BpHYR1_001855 [Brachionus plicatilis]|uniref:Uncharacterized protein n=1 Tax=Brachionus plicatilis TaxID=10195 RepID=A0A3M7Q112_BRAPC|nr:hypothetical protein BpHYR1_001855 [Brachionus plicatilis]